MNLFADIRAIIIKTLDDMVLEGDLLPPGLDFKAVTVEPPRDPSHGDMASNAAMVLARAAKAKPTELAERLAERLQRDPHFSSIEIAGPGFLNLRLTSQVWSDVVRGALQLGNAYGRSDLGAGKNVNVEYVSANPTGPLHMGHARGAVFGDALASLLSFCGHSVTREYYINDAGSQVDTLARSVYLRYLEAHGKTPEFPEGTYPGDYLIEVGEALKAAVADGYLAKDEESWLAEVRTFATDAMMELIRADLASIGVNMDVFFSEKSIYETGRIEAAIENLKSKDLIYWGTLPPPKGKPDQNWQAREQWLFRSTAFGDDEDRPVQKADGSWAYFAPDIAYHYDKLQRGFDTLIDVFGEDHGGYVKRMQAAVSALSDQKAEFDIKITRLVKVMKDGSPLKMSKRAGTFVSLRDVVDMVGSDVARFVMLMRKNDAPIELDVDKVREQSKDNPVFYVQYAHARIASVLRKADFDASDATLIEAANVSSHPAEIALVRKIAEWPRAVEIATRSHEPHRIAFFLHELASEVHSLWNAGHADPSLRFLIDGEVTLSQQKIANIRAAAVVISTGLGILGVKPMEEMR